LGRSRPRRLRPAGGYRRTASFQTATLVYDATYWFCEKFLGSNWRGIDQMVQAARSGRQNIAEGSRAGATSSKSELHLVNVARASLEELLLDFEDYLRQRFLPQWERESPEALEVREVPQEYRRRAGGAGGGAPGDLTGLTDRERHALYSRWLDRDDPAVRVNAIICLIHQANYLLDQQIAGLERDFIEGGGYSEQLAAARIEERERRRRGDRPDPTDQADPTDRIPQCPQCGGVMVLRTARAGKNAGRQFWGCRGYPECRGVVEL
jgi:four helix bundle suffix protein